MSNLKEKGNPIRKEKFRINRGIELILRGRTPQKEIPNIILFELEKLIPFFKKEINVYFKFSLNINKSQLEE